MELEQIRKDAIIRGIAIGQTVRVIGIDPICNDALTLYYRDADNRLRERMVFHADEPDLELAETGRPWSFDGNAEDFKLAAEAYRIHLAHLFDPLMAVHTSNVEPLPHQITAVYECMLPHQPLRYVLADDPGAGKTIMAGLYLRELMVRGDVKRCLIVAPGNLVEQWQDEMDQSSISTAFTASSGTASTKWIPATLCVAWSKKTCSTSTAMTRATCPTSCSSSTTACVTPISHTTRRERSTPPWVLQPQIIEKIEV